MSSIELIDYIKTFLGNYVKSVVCGTAILNDMDLKHVKKILKKKDVNYVNNKYETALSIASKFKNYKLIKLLIKNGADVHHIDTNGYTPLMSIAIQNIYKTNLKIKTKMMRLLIKHDSDIEYKRYDNLSVQQIIVNQNYPTIMWILFKYGMIIDKDIYYDLQYNIHRPDIYKCYKKMILYDNYYYLKN